jgi:1,2-phenylacetyl-CoA epoxidase PaaB subunit
MKSKNPMKTHYVKVYARSKKFTEHTFLKDFVINAESAEKAGKIARENFAKRIPGATIEHVEEGGFRRTPGSGRPL